MMRKIFRWLAVAFFVVMVMGWGMSYWRAMGVYRRGMHGGQDSSMELVSRQGFIFFYKQNTIDSSEPIETTIKETPGTMPPPGDSAAGIVQEYLRHSHDEVPVHWGWGTGAIEATGVRRFFPPQIANLKLGFAWDDETSDFKFIHQTERQIRVPWWFLAGVTGVLAFFVWRKTRPKGRGFAVEEAVGVNEKH